MRVIFHELCRGVPWRHLPERHGPWTRAYNRFNLWSGRGIWERMIDAWLRVCATACIRWFSARAACQY
jgi:transposase